MKIGEFAQKFNVKKSTIRYYTDQKVLLPVKTTNKIIYDSMCEEDMKQVLELREMGFSIDEIKKFLNLFRLKGVVNDEGKMQLEHMINSKKLELQHDIELIQHQIVQLEQLRNRIQSTEAVHSSGFPLECLSYLECPRCRESFNLYNAEIKNMQIINGQLSCICGFKYEIEKGILVPEEQITIDTTLVKVELRKWEDYMSRIPEELVELMAKCGQYYCENNDFWQNGTVFIFNEAAADQLIYRIHKLFSEDKIYIFVNPNKEELIELKHLLEAHNSKGKWIFVCYNRLLPIKPVVDRVFDALGYLVSMYYSAEDGNNLKWISDTWSNGAEMLFTCVKYDLESNTYKKIPQYHQYFNQDNVIKMLKSLGIKIDKSIVHGSIYNMSKMFKFHIDGDAMDCWSCRGRYYKK
ncbi:MerR family transcriptional regulator [Wukongibacter baidiensis]|uniref:MerR family transcriptional regulator n=1 Tax=Wukongibacter baidiensis TaxID=1723361 RepID=UPI003D7FE322